MTKSGKLENKLYKSELERLQVELVKLQEWVKHNGLRVVVVFEGRDAAGKGGSIKRIAEKLNPRVCKIAALPAPTEREQTQWYFQRYTPLLPAAGEMVLFDRRSSWACPDSVVSSSCNFSGLMSSCWSDPENCKLAPTALMAVGS